MDTKTKYLFINISQIVINYVHCIGSLMIPKTFKEDGFGTAHIMAICKYSGYATLAPQQGEDFGEDLTVREVSMYKNGKGDSWYDGTGNLLDIQIKTSYKLDWEDDCVKFWLSKKAYNKLVRNQGATHRILVLVALPGENETDWLKQTENELALRRCAYWKYLEGEDLLEEETGKIITFKKEDIFTTEVLNKIFQKIKNDEDIHDI